jgi:hypothetical protein
MEGTSGGCWSHGSRQGQRVHSSPQVCCSTLKLALALALKQAALPSVTALGLFPPPAVCMPSAPGGVCSDVLRAAHGRMSPSPRGGHAAHAHGAHTSRHTKRCISHHSKQ